MKSLQYLNTVAATTYTYTENRTPNVIFDRRAPKFVTFILDNNSFSVPSAINIIEIVRPDETNIQYVLELPPEPAGMTVNFGTLPAGIDVIQVGSIYTVRGIDSIDDWEAIKNPTVTFPITYEGNIFCDISIKYNTAQGIQTLSYEVGTFIPFSRMVASASLECELSPATDGYAALRPGFYLAADLEYSGLSSVDGIDWLVGVSTDFEGPQITSLIEDTYTVEIEPNDVIYVSDISETGSGAGSFDTVNKILTITGTKNEVNDSLRNLSFSSQSVKADFTFEYILTRAGDPAYEETRIQQARCMNLQYLSDARGTATYQINTESLIGTSSPIIYDPDYADPTSTYIITVDSPSPSLIQEIGLSGSSLTRWGLGQTVTSTDVNDLPKSCAYGSTHNIMAVGEYLDDTASTNAGKITIYEKTNGVWEELDSVVGLGLGGGESQIGTRLLMADDDTIISSGYLYYTSNANDPKGRVAIYERTPLGWEVTQTLAAPVDLDDANFGFQISATRNGDTLAVSETNNGSNSRYGKVHIYNRSGTGDYTLTTTIDDPDTDDITDFGGLQVKLNPSGTRIVISRTTGTQDTYFYSQSGGSWTLDEHLNNVTRYIEWVDDDSYLWQDGTSFYLYTRQPGSNYTQQATFTPLNDDMFSEAYIVGFKLNLAKDLIVVQVDLTEKYIFIDFDSSDNSFTEQRLILSEMHDTTDWMVSNDGLEVVFVGRTQSNTDYGWKTVTYSTKTNDQLYNAETSTLRIYGTKTQLNYDIDSMTLTSSVGSVNTIALNVSVDTPEGNEQTKLFKAEYTD